jgi:hypothetical protein
MPLKSRPSGANPPEGIGVKVMDGNPTSNDAAPGVDVVKGMVRIVVPGVASAAKGTRKKAGICEASMLKLPARLSPTRQMF